MAEKATVRLTGNWEELNQILRKTSNPVLFRRSVRKAFGREAHRLRKIIVKGFNSQGPAGVKWKKLSRMTIAMRRAVHGRRGTKALMLSGDLRASVKAQSVGQDWFVGVHRKEPWPDGPGGMVNLATLHELGSKKPVTIKVTPKMRAFFMAMFFKTTTPAQRKRMAKAKRKGRKGRTLKYAIMPLAQSTKVIVVKIPARPFIGPVWEAEKDNSAKNVIADTLQFMGLEKLS